MQRFQPSTITRLISRTRTNLLQRTTTRMASNNNNAAEPGLIAGHAQWVKGATVEAIGSATGSEAWRSSGAEEKAAGINEMKEAGEARKAAAADGKPGYGKPEELAGKAFGCEGMEQEGKESEQK